MTDRPHSPATSSGRTAAVRIGSSAPAAGRNPAPAPASAAAARGLTSR